MTNKRLTVTYKDTQVTLSQLSKLLGIPYSTLYQRLQQGTALLKPRPHKPTKRDIAHTLITHNAKTQTIRKWADELGIKYSVLKMRFMRGDRGDHLLRVSSYTAHAGESPTTVMITYLNQTRSIYNWSRRWGIGFVRPFELYQQGERNPAILFNQHTDT
jgi:hypothetical protein